MILALIALLLSQLAPQPAYVLDHPIDPDLLIIATQDGRYPFALLAGLDCSWLHSDMNVNVASRQGQLWQVSGGGGDACNIVVSNPDQPIDPTPCLTDETGLCSIDAEHQWT